MNAHELSQRIAESYSAVWRELAHLEQLGILLSEKIGNSKVFRVNSLCPIASELRSLVLKTEGFGDRIRTSLAGFSTIQAAFIYGSFASGEIDSRSDIDLMVIGELDLAAFSDRIALLEAELHRPINYTIFSQSEWLEKIENGNPFAMNVRQSPKVMLIGGEDGL